MITNTNMQSLKKKQTTTERKYAHSENLLHFWSSVPTGSPQGLGEPQ